MMRSNLSDNNSPFTKEQIELLDNLILSLSDSQLQWLSGYLAGIRELNGKKDDRETTTLNSDNTAINLTILYGTETGNSATLADVLGKKAEKNGIRATVKNLADYRKSQLKKESTLVIITSTHGDGDPPEFTIDFYEYLQSSKVPELKSLRYSVLALGDSSYENFCQTGRDYDTRLSELGGERFYDRVDCDVDYEDPANQWMDGVIDSLKELFVMPASAGGVNVPVSGNHDKVPESGIGCSRSNPFQATVVENLKLNGRGSKKETRHVELMIDENVMSYEPGDSLGVLPQNSDRAVNNLICSLQLDPDEMVKVDKEEISFREALKSFFEITTISGVFLKRYAELARSKHLNEILIDKTKLADYKPGRHIIDVVEDFPVRKIYASEFISTLRRLSPRLYSIASSYHINPGEVHLTVAAVRFQTHGRYREGVASTYISDQLPEGARVPVYVQKNESFRLPQDPSVPIIMVGPGTGIAPFRAFMEERQYQGAKGKNWLFFGDRNFRTDFLYQLEWQKKLKSGDLSKIDVAFSRDNSGKTYVQHRLWEKRKEVYSWLKEGAYFYVCGDANRMAPDVHNTLKKIICDQGQYKAGQADEYLKGIQNDKRYLKDVY